VYVRPAATAVSVKLQVPGVTSTGAALRLAYEVQLPNDVVSVLSEATPVSVNDVQLSTVTVGKTVLEIEAANVTYALSLEVGCSWLSHEEKIIIKINDAIAADFNNIEFCFFINILSLF